jgi:hypothetical protein
MSVDPTSPPFCPAFRDALQTCLDARTDALPAECEAHRAACASCRHDYAAAMLVRVFRRPIACAPEGMTDRLVSLVLADAVGADRSRRITATAAAIMATAAALLLCIAIVQRFRGPLDDESGVATGDATIAKDQTPARISVDDSLANAGDALASLARRTTVEPAKLLPSAPSVGMTDPLPDPTEPAAHSLASIREGATSGFEPLGRTARRAFALFIRDMPVQADHKPGS